MNRFSSVLCRCTIHLPRRTFATSAATEPLSKRKQFNQISPPAGVYERLERLGFGSLRGTKRFQSVKHAVSKKKEREKRAEEPEHNYPLMSFFADLGEIAVVGRSNVGKSSLLNSLAQSTIVRTSDKPGLTQQLNFYNVTRLFYMVDMPGYGFAHAEEEDRRAWRELIEHYISHRKTLKRIYVVIDARHGLKIADKEFLTMLDSKKVKFQIVITKSDIPNLPTLAKRVVVVQQDIQAYRNAVKEILVVSSKSGAGINQMRKEMLFLMGHLDNRSADDSKSK
ncbi:P-loop containing nucleoside triphosphate hydrolase protein [Syncephalastrum racemosum]|uniref:P-loop containing nucleoside triphosphate hydrolase protein n=1 Tax=Syncephalastrum racemosum TaxID=13706 RepID=A0A1X2HHY1_SYNRA|nr:P-loop containing nucleoside triphosphate hydrolase protein [Syncephalastrum racemosum]